MKWALLIGVLALLMAMMAVTPAQGFYWEITYPPQITVGDQATVEIYIETDDAVDLHVAFKGCFRDPPNYWTDHWTYDEKIMPLGAGMIYTVEFPFMIPYNLCVEKDAYPKFQAQYYYFYLFACESGGGWGPGIPSQSGGPGGAWTTYDPDSPNHVVYPDLDYRRLLTTAIGMIKAKIIPSDLRKGIKQSLLAKLENATKLIDKAYDQGNLHRLNGARGMMEAFVNELNSNNEAAQWSKAGECIDLANFIIGWIVEAM